MSKPIQIASASTPGNLPKKNNEDRRVHHTQGNYFGAAVCDGVSQRCELSGRYPRSHGEAAARIVAQHLMHHFQREQPEQVCLERVLQDASNLVREYNERVNRWDICDWTIYDRSATTVVCAVGERQSDESIKGFVTSCGDSLAIKFAHKQQPEILALDQLTMASLRQGDMPWEDWVTWSREIVRNNLVMPEGYGVIDGNEHFLHFLKVRPFILQPGDTLLLGSDALRFLGSQKKSDDPESYEYLNCDVLDMPPDILLPHLTEQVREQEKILRSNPDDATTIIIRA